MYKTQEGQIIKPIETVYKGYRFRSRLEARWAVFLDALGIEWEYEPEGFELDGGEWYLPDFRILTERGPFWLEIKGPCPSDRDILLVTYLSRETKDPVFIAHGLPGKNAVRFASPRTNFVLIPGNLRGEHGESQQSISWPAFWAVASLVLHCIKNGNTLDDIELAAESAKQARFEHGQSGPPSAWNKG